MTWLDDYLEHARLIVAEERALREAERPVTQADIEWSDPCTGGHDYETVEACRRCGVTLWGPHS